MNNKNIDKITQYAHKSILYEVLLSPKPGLVDRINTGSHHDMDIFTFIDAINALLPYLHEYSVLGYNHEQTAEPKELFLNARKVGCKAESAMMKATNNVNTHKGANFSFAIILAASTYIIKKDKVEFPLKPEDTERLFQYVALMCEGLVSHDFKKLNQKEKLSYGENIYKKYGISGIRGVAESGYPIITKVVLPYLRKNIKLYPENKEGVFLHSLALIMSEAEDTNLIHRGGLSAYQLIRAEAKEIYLNTTPNTIKASFQNFDQKLIDQHLSPGGAADLLSIAIYVSHLEGIL